jgi:hypothetical protein
MMFSAISKQTPITPTSGLDLRKQFLQVRVRLEMSKRFE